MTHTATQGWQRGEPVRYIRRDIPAFEIPSYRGQRYEALVPDTLDIQERCALAVNGLTAPTDPEVDYLMYFSASFSANPPVMSHGHSDHCLVKFMEALPLMRIVSGSDHNGHVDPVWMAWALHMMGPDGLIYWPSFPWAKKPGYADLSPDDSDQYTMPQFVGFALSAMTVYMLRDPQGPWQGEIERAVQALDNLAIHKDDYAYYPQGGFTPTGPRPREAEIPTGLWASLVGWTTQGLAQFYRASGYELAGQLAGKLARYIRHHGIYFGPNGEFLPNYSGPAGGEDSRGVQVHPFDPGPPPANTYIHFWCHVRCLLGFLDYAVAAGDDEMAEFVRQSFEWAKKKGAVTVGYFPENVDHIEYEGSETCQVAGMIGLALKLSQAGVGDYWDDADRWVRNQFAENQLRRADWIYRFAEGGIIYPRRRVPKTRVDETYQSAERVPERNIGGFAGWPSANDFYTGQGTGMMHCCTGNGTRALYYIWEHIVTYHDGELKVNLLLNRPSKWADVHSYIPYEGQVDVHVKQPCTLKIRIPEWVKPEETHCVVNGAAHQLTWEGRYAVVGAVSEGQVVQLMFPISEREQAVDIEKQRYLLIIKGNDVVNIDPPGRFCPFYQRDHYRENTVRWKKVARFVSDETLLW